MKALRYLAIIYALSLLGGVSFADEATLDTKIADVTLEDYLGARHSLSDWDHKGAIVIVFLGTECPLAKLYGTRLAELAERYEPRGVQIVGINSNRQDTLREIANYARVHKIAFPILKDAAHDLANELNVGRTPEAFVLDGQRRIKYRGLIDDQFGVGYARDAATQNYVAAALDEVLAGKPVATPVTEPVGCYVGRSSRKPPTGDITYSNQIARMMQVHCLRCHREGQIGPFALTSYDEVAAWAETMQEVMDEGRMPPWHANPKHGEFSNDASMTAADKDLFRQWIQNGMPEGDPTDLPAPIEFAEDWQIGKPDVVYRMPHAFKVPAKGVVPYQYFEIPTEFDADVWVQGAEIRPGNRSVVHHCFVFYLPPGQDEPNAEDPVFNSVAGFAPGMPAELWPEGHARLIPAGSRLVFQMHYTPNGSEQLDQTEVGLIFADRKTVKKQVKFVIAVNTDFKIPPGAPNHHVRAGHKFTQDTLLHAMIPHMHYRGKAFRFAAHYPDGRQEILLDVPHYDFNWQNAYLLKEPKLMPKGTVLVCAGNFDNSAENLVNPDPTKEVTWGDQTWDEMMLGLMVVSLPDWVKASEYPKIAHVEGDQFNVTFRYRPESEHKKVDMVYLAGSFNDWKENGRAMSGPDPDGWFQTVVRLTNGYYEYKFVVNGTDWTHDPGNPDQNGPFSNSVLRVRRVKK